MSKNILIVESRYYEDVAEMLFDSVCDQLKENNFNYKSIEVLGALEIPILISKAITEDIYDGFIALGCVIKGQTPHFEFICSASTNAIMELSVESKKPIGNGIITCLTMSQAKARKTKGTEAAKAVMSVLSQK